MSDDKSQPTLPMPKLDGPEPVCCFDKFGGLLTKDPNFAKLESYYNQHKLILKNLFQEDSKRAEKYSIKMNHGNFNFLFDYSKNLVNDDIMKMLFDLAKSRGIEEKKHAMFKGAKINFTENRAVLHTALRNRSSDVKIMVEGKDVMPGIRETLDRCRQFSDKIRDGSLRGYSGEKITDVVNIGIGGSDLGPVMVSEALKMFHTGPNVHFVSNIDGFHIDQVLKKCHAPTTLVIVASKTFTTQETMKNASTARNWFLTQAKDKAHVAKNFVALSTNHEKVNEFGIERDYTFGFWDWVGGRYSVWSSIGLSVMLAIGYKEFENFLSGGCLMDAHFYNSPLEENIPIIMAMLGVWYINFHKADTQAILPYDQALHRLPAYLQQLDMESNGKCVTSTGERVNYPTGPIVWGEPGTNGQHAFYQLIHQGSRLVPADFIAAVHSQTKGPSDLEHHKMLLANFLAQTKALMVGKNEAEARKELEAKGMPKEAVDKIAPHKVFEGNRPTNSFLFNQMNAFSLGCLIAAYEHKVFVQGSIWGINSFDQWGVELGKELANSILPQLKDGQKVTSGDSSTNMLLNFINLAGSS